MVDDIYELLDAPPTLAVAVVVISSAWLLVLAIASFARAITRRRLAAEEAASLTDPARALHEGEAVLSGTVEHAADEEVAVRVEITQHGSESESSGSWSYRWEEIDRKVIVRPFYLALPDGQRVRVEPSGDIDVADDLDGRVLISRTSRKLTAELIPGEVVHIRGHLERGGDAQPGTAYRDVTWGWLLGPADGRMLLSSHPLGDGLRARAQFHLRWGLIASAVLVMLQITLVGFYQRAAGDVVPVTVVDKIHSTHEDSDGDTVHDYELAVYGDDGIGGHADVSANDFNAVDKGTRVATRRAGRGFRLGGQSTLWWPHLVGIVIITIGLALSHRMRRRQSRPWFRRKVVETGSGRLP